MLTVYYDGKCGLCSKEIAHYRRVAPSGAFQWRDVASDPDALADHGITQSEALRLLHAKDETGALHVGVDAFIQIWQRLNRWHWLAKIGSLPGIYAAAKVAYRVFADRRFRKLRHCQIAAARDAGQAAS